MHHGKPTAHPIARNFWFPPERERRDLNNVSIEDISGDERTIEPKNSEALKDLNLGDHVLVKKGILTKEGGAGPSTPPPVPGY